MCRSAETKARPDPSRPKTNAPKSFPRSSASTPSSIFDQDTPADIVRLVQPDILVKGADWPADQIVGRDTVEARGGKVVLVPVEQGLLDTSSQAIRQRIS